MQSKRDDAGISASLRIISGLLGEKGFAPGVSICRRVWMSAMCIHLMKSSLVRRVGREARKHMYSGIFSARSVDDRIQIEEETGSGGNAYLLDMTQEHLRIRDVSDVSIHFQ